MPREVNRRMAIEFRYEDPGETGVVTVSTEDEDVLDITGQADTISVVYEDRVTRIPVDRVVTMTVSGEELRQLDAQFQPEVVRAQLEQAETGAGQG